MAFVPCTLSSGFWPFCWHMAGTLASASESGKRMLGYITSPTPPPPPPRKCMRANVGPACRAKLFGFALPFPKLHRGC